MSSKNLFHLTITYIHISLFGLGLKRYLSCCINILLHFFQMGIFSKSNSLFFGVRIKSTYISPSKDLMVNHWLDLEASYFEITSDGNFHRQSIWQEQNQCWLWGMAMLCQMTHLLCLSSILRKGKLCIGFGSCSILFSSTLWSWIKYQVIKMTTGVGGATS